VLASSDELGEDPGVLFFQKAYVAAHPVAVKAFLAAGAKAGAAINADNDRYRQFLVDQVGLPAAVKADFRFVTYRAPRLASEASFRSIWSWMTDKGLLTAPPSNLDWIDSKPVDSLRSTR